MTGPTSLPSLAGFEDSMADSLCLNDQKATKSRRVLEEFRSGSSLLRDIVPLAMF